MTNEEFNGVSFNDLDPPGSRVSRSSEFSVVNSTEIALNIPHKVHESGDYRQDNSLHETRKVDNSKTGKALFVNLRPLYATDMCYLEECSGSECRVEHSLVNK